MTTVDAPNRAAANAPAAMPAGMVSVFKHIAFMKRLDSVLPEAGQEPQWFEPVIQAMGRLPWDNDNWRSDNPSPTQPGPAARLLVLLAQILDADTPPPYMVPTWRGGVSAEWHQNGIDLEIEADPDGWLEYYFENDTEEYEGPLTTENLPELVRRARGLLITHTGKPSESDDQPTR